MLTTLNASSARLSTASSLETAPRPRPAVLKYLQQRIKELEQELENKRVRLFESEEARAELEALVEGHGIVLTPESSSADSAAQDEDSLGEEEEEETGAEERIEGANEGENRYANLQLIEHYQSVMNLLVAGHNEKIKDLEDNHRTELELLKSDHEEAMKQRQDDHEVEHQAQAHELENLGQLYNDRLNICATILAEKTERHNAELTSLRTESASIAHAIEHSTANVRNAAMTILEASFSEMSTHTNKLKALFGEDEEAAKVAVTVTSPGGSTDNVDNEEGSANLSMVDFVRIMAEKQKKTLD